MANFNNLAALSKYERHAQGLWNLFNQTQNLVKFKIKKFPGQRINVDLKKWADIMARNFTKVVKSHWQGWHSNINTLVGQLSKFGLSPLLWTDERDWRWRTIELQRFYVSDQTLADMDQLTGVCLDTTFTAQYLVDVYNYIIEHKLKDSSPWNIDELCTLLVDRANSAAKLPSPIIDFMDLQRRLQNNDLSFGALFTDSIKLVSMLYKQYDGSITHYMFDPLRDNGKFLYKLEKQYNRMTEAMVVFTSSPGDFTLHSNKGIGQKIFAGCQVMNQLDCSAVDGSRWAMTPLIKSLSVGSKDFEAIRFTPGSPTNIGSAEFIENTMGANLNQVIQVSQYMDQKIENNIVSSGDDLGIPDRDVGSKSAPEVRLESFKEFGVMKCSVAHIYNSMDIVVYNMSARMMHSEKGDPGYEAAAEWKELCIEEGVPELVFDTKDTPLCHLPKHLEVKAARAAGDGSNVSKILGMQSVAPFVGSLGAEGQARYTWDIFETHLGEDYAEAYLADSNVPDEISGGASLASLENTIMKFGESPLFSPNNEHQTHIEVHLGLCQFVIQNTEQQQMDAIQAEKIFAQAIPHTSQHLQFISRDPLAQQFLQQIRGKWDEITRYAELIKANAEKAIKAEMQKRQQQQQQMNSDQMDQQRKDVVSQRDQERKDRESQSKQQRAEQQSQDRADLQREKIHLDASNEAVKNQLEAGNKAHKNTLDSKVDLQKVSSDTLSSDLTSMNGSTPAPSDYEVPQ